ncbi:MAG TPA: neutral/alkaline non-lysosomal ceramidase N-terminal domain-containing protein [Bryobacteraceae bacterium]|nr:neutral/alkaline non-lysosomal ceramidase N-terminal domain-containing protein [Bryobacteraceae bacterium]
MTRLVWVVLLSLPLSAEFRAGVARVRITPPLPAWLSGYAARSKPAETVSLDLWAKALALDDGNGERFVVVTADLLGFTREITDEIAARVQKKHGLARRQVVFNASHTHSGPLIWPRLTVAASTGDDVDRWARAYADALTGKLENLIGEALGAVQPARAEFAIGTAGFAINRRVEPLARIRPGESFPAPTDHSVPVLRVRGHDGRVLAIVFGYACHNTTLTAQFLEVSGDYAGYAQAALERTYPGTTALFVELCGADQNPNPRSRRDLPEQHGEALAAAVTAALDGKPRRIEGRLRSAWELIELPFQSHMANVYQAEAKSADPFFAKRGRLMLEAFDAGRPVRSTAYPVQAFRIGEGPAWIALGGEVVIDYQAQLKREYGSDRVVVLGYSNVVMGYIPSRRVQREGGYEAGDSMVYFLQPGWFTEEVEDLVLGSARRVLSTIGFRAR